MGWIGILELSNSSDEHEFNSKLNKFWILKYAILWTYIILKYLNTNRKTNS